MNKKVLSLVLVSIMILGVLSGCSGGGGDKIKVSMVTDLGGVNDQSFNQSAWEGLKKAEKELGIKASYQESTQDADYVPNLEQAYDNENDLIFGIGMKLDKAILDAAKKYPDQKYAIVDVSFEDETPDNVVGIVFKQEQPSFLVGYIAGKMTKTGKVGFVGGMEIPVISEFENGFKAGVKYANKDSEVFVQYAESFGDPGKGKAIANSMYQKGADIIFHASGGTGDGVIEAAKEQDKYAIGVDKDQNYLAPDNVITSAMKRVDAGVYNLVKEMKDGEFPGGTTVVYGLEDGAVDIAPTSDKHVPKEILDEVEDLKKKIIDGDIVVPTDDASYEEFLKTLE